MYEMNSYGYYPVQYQPQYIYEYVPAQGFTPQQLTEIISSIVDIVVLVMFLTYAYSQIKKALSGEEVKSPISLA
jgi:hypothetical protein